MDYKTHNEKSIDINMTHLQGYCEAETTYQELVDLFAKPDSRDGYKVDAQWQIEFDDGQVATIYNYKNGKNYEGKDGLEVAEMSGSDWHIGGHDGIVVERIHKIVRDFRRQTQAA